MQTRLKVVRFAFVLGISAAPVIAYGNPTGPEVVQGTATFNTTGNTLTVTPSANAIIQWRSFNVAPGETVRFVQPSGGSVVNRVPGGIPSVAGQVEASGTVLFLNGSTLSGSDSSRDLAGIVDSAGRLQRLPASRRSAPRDDGPPRAVTLSGNRVFVIGSENVRRSRGRILLDPGVAGELGDVGIPYVRVYVEPPVSTAVDLDSLVSRRPVLGMFNALFPERRSARSEIGITEMAASPVVPADVEGRLAIAFRAPLEDRAGVPVPVVRAPVEERPVLAFRAPAEERIPAWFAAPVEDRSILAMPLVPAAVEERLVLAFNAPVEDRDIVFFPAVLAPFESRAVLAFNAPVEERAVRLMVIPPVPVEDRQVLALQNASGSAGAPLLAAVEDREIVVQARLKSIEAPRQLVLLARPTVANQVVNPQSRTAEVPIRVAIAPSVVLPLATVSTGSAEPVVRLPAVQRRLPRIMVDHRGAVFHL